MTEQRIRVIRSQCVTAANRRFAPHPPAAGLGERPGGTSQSAGALYVMAPKNQEREATALHSGVHNCTGEDPANDLYIPEQT